MDQKIVFAMMALAQKNKTVGRLSDILYRKASMLFFNLYAGAGLYLVLFGDRKIYLYVLVPFCCLLTGYALRSAIKRKRPYQRYCYKPGVDRQHKKSDSCPSNHSLSSMVIACACVYVFGVYGAAVVVLAIFTGLSRVFVGVHYFSDVLAGWGLGILFGVAGFCLLI